MAEKGGKGFSTNRKKKLASRQFSQASTASKGKDNGFEKDDLVEIDSSDSESDIGKRTSNGTSPKGSISLDIGKRTSNGTSPKGSIKSSKEAPKSGKKASCESENKSSSETPASKGDWSKGGKSYSSGKAGGKGSLPQASAVKPPVTEVELKLEMDLPSNARTLTDCEAAAVLQGIQESLVGLSNDPNIKMPDSFNKALQYCVAGTNYTNAESARQLLDTLKSHGVTEGEICMIANVCPESVDELYALVPSLKANRRKNEGPIRVMLPRLAELKQS